MLYIFDKDGTICKSISGERFITSADDQRLIEGVSKKIQSLHNEGHTLAVASNQGAVAFGIMTLDEAIKIVKGAAELIQAELYLFCPHHPGGNNEFAIECDCRKPKPGMINQIMASAKVGPKDTVFVGDRPEDAAAALVAGVRFIWAKDFFGRQNDL